MDFFGNLLAPFSMLLDVSSKLYWPYVASSLIVAGVIHLKNRTPVRAEKDLERLLEIGRQPSAVLDYKVFLINTFFTRWFFGIVALGSVVNELQRGVFDGLTAVLGPASVSGILPWMAAIVVLLGTFLAMDFGLWLVHYFQHRVPFLWEFHKVHHSAEVMTPITVFRLHPMDEWLNLVVLGCIAGCVEGVARYFIGYSVSGVTLLGINALLALFYLCGYHLRHSHIWWSYPGWISRWLISPAQHQIHHSRERRHWNKNYGFALAVWDRIAGSLYVPREREELVYGLEDGGEAMRSLWDTYVRPFGRSLVALRGDLRLLMAVAIIVSMCAAFYSSVLEAASLSEQNGTVFVEDMTWAELRDRLESGADTVIIPTGGTEQNGPHMILGKHNYIVRYAAGEIAREMGSTVVAPVLAYSPEGAFEPPTGHMLYTGTITLAEPAFEAVLEGAARSFKAHGFKTICFLGDSGGNQAAQARVAERLGHEWPDVRVIHVGDYYEKNGQFEWLRNRGFERASIGRHAGIRDTSELTVVHPRGLRPLQMAASDEASYPTSGVHGDPSLASADLGVVMLRLKIDAALAQIHRDVEEPRAP